MTNVCKDCKHHYVTGQSIHEFYTIWTHYCRKVETKELDLVTGQTFTNKVYCNDRRKTTGDECPDFEQCEVKPKPTHKPLWKFW